MCSRLMTEVKFDLNDANTEWIRVGLQPVIINDEPDISIMVIIKDIVGKIVAPAALYGIDWECDEINEKGINVEVPLINDRRLIKLSHESWNNLKLISTPITRYITELSAHVYASVLKLEALKIVCTGRKSLLDLASSASADKFAIELASNSKRSAILISKISMIENQIFFSELINNFTSSNLRFFLVYM